MKRLDRPLRGVPRAPRVPLTVLASAAALAVTAFAAQAQTPVPAAAPTAAPASAPTNAPATQLERVVVTGQAAATDRALADQQAADNIISVVRGDGIGRLPDKNAAEALQRVPGVSIERDQGEGRYVRVRGLGPDLNAVTINGSLVPSPERDRRAVMLDVLPSSLIGALEVTKTLTPDMDANSLGGTIDIKSLSAFDRKGSLFSAELGAGHNSNTEQSSPFGSLVWSDRFMDGKLGVAVGLNAERRRFGSDNTETGGAWDGNALEGFERRDYRITRERAGGAVNLELRPQAGSSYYLRSMLSRFSDDETRQAHIVEFADPQTEGTLGDAESTRELKDRKETQRIFSLTLGTDQQFGDWTLGVAAGLSRSQEDTPQHIAGASFEGGDFSGVGFSDSRKPRLIGPDAINGAAPYALNEIELERTLAKDREHNLRFDLTRQTEWFGAPGELKFGAKASRRTKTNEQTTWVLEDFEDAPFSLSPAQLGLGNYTGPAVNYPLGDFGPSLSGSALRALYQGLDLNGFVDEQESRINNFNIRENIDAAYVQGSFDLASWRVLTGVRYEGTRLRADGTGVTDGVFSDTSVHNKHTHWLPGVHLRRDLDAATTLRAAWSNSVVRPTFGQLAPGFAIDGDEAEFGNPNLKPLKSANLDVGVERRLGYAGVVSAYAFHKRIRNFVYQTDLAGTGPWAAFDEAITYANGDRARVSGLELAYSQSLRSLPAPWNGLLVSANATFSHSDARIARLDTDTGATASRSIPLPSQSKRVLNLVLGYETPVWSLRLAGNHKSRYLLEVSDVLDANRDLYVDAQTQFDLSARYALSKSLQLSFDVQNLNDAKYFVYAGSADRNAQWETYGRSYRLSLKYTLE
jgi:TonB-dependent receptor